MCQSPAYPNPWRCWQPRRQGCSTLETGRFWDILLSLRLNVNIVMMHLFLSGLHNRERSDCQEAAQKTWKILENAQSTLFPKRCFLIISTVYVAVLNTSSYPEIHPIPIHHVIPPCETFCFSLEVLRTGNRKVFKLKGGNGGWGDTRDHKLCLNMTLHRDR